MQFLEKQINEFAISDSQLNIIVYGHCKIREVIVIFFYFFIKLSLKKFFFTFFYFKFKYFC